LIETTQTRLSRKEIKMKITTFKIGDIYFRSDLYKNGRDIDNSSGDCFSSRQEAERDGEEMQSGYDPEYQKRCQGAIEFCVRKYEVLSVGEDGSLGSSVTID
jgi:hypothetical protein